MNKEKERLGIIIYSFLGKADFMICNYNNLQNQIDFLKNNKNNEIIQYGEFIPND